MKIENAHLVVDSNVHESAKIGMLSDILKCDIAESCMTGRFSKMAYSEMGIASYIGDYTVVINSTIGKFCSISWGVTIGPEEHDFSRLTTHSFLYSLKSFKIVQQKYYSPFEKPCNIGNDVWIGSNATILRGVTIGDGAVIGANSIVTKDVPPYSIVVGNPGKIIKYRFEPNIIRQLLELKWWDLPIYVISENAALFSQNPDLELIKKLTALKS